MDLSCSLNHYYIIFHVDSEEMLGFYFYYEFMSTFDISDMSTCFSYIFCFIYTSFTYIVDWRDGDICMYEMVEVSEVIDFLYAPLSPDIEPSSRRFLPWQSYNETIFKITFNLFCSTQCELILFFLFSVQAGKMWVEVKYVKVAMRVGAFNAIRWGDHCSIHCFEMVKTSKLFMKVKEIKTKLLFALLKHRGN